jgi:hypothetical protein
MTEQTAVKPKAWFLCSGKMTCEDTTKDLDFEAPSETGAEATARHELGRWLASRTATALKNQGWAPKIKGTFVVWCGTAKITGAMSIQTEFAHYYENEGFK